MQSQTVRNQIYTAMYVDLSDPVLQLEGTHLQVIVNTVYATMQCDLTPNWLIYATQYASVEQEFHPAGDVAKAQYRSYM